MKGNTKGNHVQIGRELIEINLNKDFGSTLIQVMVIGKCLIVRIVSIFDQTF